jgi:hypothetical protein
MKLEASQTRVYCKAGGFDGSYFVKAVAIRCSMLVLVTL